MSDFLSVCAEVALTSHDPDTKLGCVIVRDGVVVASGSNRFDDEADITPERLQRPLKYQWIRHAEDNALRNAGPLAAGSELHCSAHPCKDCAEKIAAAGVVKVVVPETTDQALIARWKESWAAAQAVLDAANVLLVFAARY